VTFAPPPDRAARSDDGRRDLRSPAEAAAIAGALVLEAGDARAVVSPADGGRLASVVVDGRELLVTASADGPIQWGCYPMAPWAGRVRDGRFTFEGREHALPLGLPPHAIHGVVYDRPWGVDDPTSISIELDERWPFRGRVAQRFALDADGLDVTMTLEADEPMPVVLGWHPWFRRTLTDGDEPVRLRFAADEMLVRDAQGIPTGARVPPPPGPWDDVFTAVRDGPGLDWPGRLRLELASSCGWWVVYSEPGHAICVEPQSGPPDAVNQGPGAAAIVRPGEPLVHTMRWRWARP
jgi:aldose 1-epimerase